MRNSPEHGIQDLWALIDTIESLKRKQQLKNLFRYLDEHADLQEIGASCRHHAAYRGGYLCHIVRVAKTALKLRDSLAPEMNRDSVVTCALLHDAIKGGLPLKGGAVRRYIPNPSFDERREISSYNQPWLYNQAAPGFPMGPISAVIAARWVDLTVAEVQAICGADGAFVPENRAFAHRECPLLVLIHAADYWAGHVLEGNLNANQWNSPEDALLSGQQGG